MSSYERDAPDAYLRPAYGLAKAIGGRYGLQLSEILKRNDLQAIPRFIDSFDECTDDEFGDAYLLTELLSKSEVLNLGLDKVGNALVKFHQAEEQCRHTNSLSLYFKNRSIPDFKGVDVDSVLYTARQKISGLLGDFSWDDAEPFFGFGPGAVVGLRRQDASGPNKIGMKPTVTPGCLPLARTVLTHFDLWGRFHCDLEIVPGNKVVTVPKSYKTDRVIAIEPLMNGFVQKGIGGVIRSRLRRVGINLNDQSRNQRLARLGSLTGLLATIDLSSASDTISDNVVWSLLPQDWYDAMNLCRSHLGRLPSGKLIPYQKFSSMGNGFTFELESLIFWAICSAVIQIASGVSPVSDGKDTEVQLSVYGDDLIVPSIWFGHIEWALQAVGFTLNREKSFTGDHPFRESCGMHFYRGTDITPLYLRRYNKSPLYGCWLANSLKRLAFRRNGGSYGLDGNLFPVYLEAIEHLPASFRKPLIPEGFGDGALTGDFDEVHPTRPSAKSKRAGWDGWTTRHAVPKYNRGTRDGLPSLVSELLDMRNRRRSWIEGEGSWAPYLGAPNIGHLAGKEYPLGALSRPFVWTTLFVPKQWRDLGPWV